MDPADVHSAATGSRRTLYGRSRGKTLRAYHSRLIDSRLPQLEIPAITPLTAQALFEFSPDEIWLEIGFGGGEHLLAQASRNSRVGLLGCEPFINGVAKLVAGIEARQINNIRIRAADAQGLLEQLPNAALSKVFILYPDPWPKRRQRKRRLISPPVLGELARVAKVGALILFATDIDDYAGWALNQFLKSPAFSWRAERSQDWLEPWPDWTATRYETKALREGRIPVYLTFERL